MSKHTEVPLLIFGCLPPADPITATYTLQAALFMQSFTDVVVIIDDVAPPPKSGSLPVLRESALKEQAARFSAAPRLYVLGDSFESLWALDWLKTYPGALLATNPSLHSLWRLYAETQPTWPTCYTDWLETKLPAPAAATLRRTLIDFQRESLSFRADLPAIGLFEDMATCLLKPALPLAALSTQQAVDNDTLTLVSVTDSTTSETLQLAVSTLTETGHPLRHQNCTGSDPDLAHKIRQADIVVITENTTIVPPAVTLALGSEKATICAGPWANILPDHVVFKLPKPDALHSLTAALGALLDTGIRDWLVAEAKCYTKALSYTETTSAIASSILTSPRVPLKVLPSRQIKAPCSSGAVSNRLSGQVALIGTPPPVSVMKSQHPDLDYDNCPKFATPELAERLVQETAVHASIILAEIGYEAILVSNKAPGTPWQKIVPYLMTDMPAYSFECDIKETTQLYDVTTPPALEVIFPPITLKRKKHKLRGFIKETGCFWQLDDVRNRLNCLMIIGHRKTLQIGTLSDEHHLFLLSANNTANYIGGIENKTMQLSPDPMALFSFKIALAHPKTGRHMPVTELVNALSTTKLVMETLHHSSESEMVTL